MEMGTMPYIKRKVRHKADRPNNNEWEKPDVHGCNCGAQCEEARHIVASYGHAWQ